MKSKNIILMHYKTGERDGVSLEIEKRARILRMLGANVSYITGTDGLNRENVCLIEEFNAEASYNRFLREQCFRQPYFDENTMVALYYQLELAIYKKLQQAFRKLQPHMIFIHNMFSHGCNLPATSALLKILDKYEIPTVTVHHDFWYERESLQNPQYHFIQETLDVLPPKRDYIIKHQVINSLAQAEIQRRRNIQAETIGDYFDFDQPIPQSDEYNRDIREECAIQDEDLLILHATRITGHKVIENALLFAHELEKQLHASAPMHIAGKLFSKDSRVVVLFPNFIEPEAAVYFQALTCYQKELGVKAIWASDKFSSERQHIGGMKKYSFWDSYVVADLVTYTSIQEGFGNQFLEAIYFKKVPVILEYPVFEVDLQHEGYEYISLGRSRELTVNNGLRLAKSACILQAVNQTIRILQDEQAMRRIVEKNFHIAKTCHDVSLLKGDLIALTQ
jgi:glycosyltransferase involved in cell wall biosynthesis